jgi:hypothetical protein
MYKSFAKFTSFSLSQGFVLALSLRITLFIGDFHLVETKPNHKPGCQPWLKLLLFLANKERSKEITALSWHGSTLLQWFHVVHQSACTHHQQTAR